MMFENLVKYVQKSVARDGLKISKYGISEMKKRWDKSENQGGYSDSLKKLTIKELYEYSNNYIYTKRNSGE